MRPHRPLEAPWMTPGTCRPGSPLRNPDPRVFLAAVLALALATIDGIRRSAPVAGAVEAVRADDVFVADLRLEKDFRLGSALAATVSLDAFNATGERPVLQREGDLGTPRADFLDEVLAPRVYRLGLRLRWN